MCVFYCFCLGHPGSGSAGHNHKPVAIVTSYAVQLPPRLYFAVDEEELASEELQGNSLQASQWQQHQQQQLLPGGQQQQEQYEHQQKAQQQQRLLLAAQLRCRLRGPSAATMATGKLDPVKDKVQLGVVSQVFGPAFAALCCQWGP